MGRTVQKGRFSDALGFRGIVEQIAVWGLSCLVDAGRRTLTKRRWMEQSNCKLLAAFRKLPADFCIRRAAFPRTLCGLSASFYEQNW